MRVLKLTLGNFSSAYFLYFSASSVKHPDGHVLASVCARLCWSLIWLHAVRTSMCHVQKWAFCFLCQTHTLLFACSIMLCCVCFLWDWSRDFGILCTSFLIPKYYLWLSLFSWALVLFRILKSLIDYDLRDCAWISFSVFILDGYYESVSFGLLYLLL
jgi:hypothetical protein